MSLQDKVKTFHNTAPVPCWVCYAIFGAFVTWIGWVLYASVFNMG